MAASNKIQVGYIEAQDGAQFQVDAGTAAAPGLAFDDSLATGLYSPGTGQIAWSTSGKQTALRILADGKVGVDCSPTVAFEVNGTIKASAIDAPIEGTLDDWIVHAGDTNTKIGFPANDQFSVETGGSQRLLVQDAGAKVTGTLELTDSLYWDGDTNTTIDNAGGTADFIRFKTGGTTVMDIDADQHVKLHDNRRLRIGASNDIQIFHNSGNNRNYFFSPQNDVYHEFAVSNSWTVQTSAGDKRIHCPANGTSTAVEIYHNGSKKLETTSLGARVVGDVQMGGTAGVRFHHTGTTSIFETQTAGDALLFKTTPSGGSTTERLRITSDGHFGTGNVTPTTQSGKVFHLHAGANQQRFHMTNNTTGVSATDGFEIIVEQSANTRIRNFEAGDMAFDTGGSNNEVMRITSQGNLNISATTGLSNMTSFRHINLGNNLIINAGTSAGGYTGFQNNAYLNTSGNWVRIRDDHTSAFGMDDGVFYFRHAGAGTGNISWKYPLTIEASGRLLTKTDQSTTGLVIQNTTHDSILRIEAQAANKNSTIHFADGADGDVGIIDYDHNNNQLSFTVNAAQRMWFDNSNAVYVSGANHSNLEVRSNDASTKATMQTVQGSEIRLGATSNHPLAIYSGGLQACKIKTNGFTGVGIDDPTQARFVVKQDSGNTAALIKANTGASLAFGGVTQPRVLMEASATASDLILYRATGSSWGSAGWYKTLTIQSNGAFRTHKADSNLRPYPIIGGPDIGSSDQEYGQFNYADVMAPNADLGSWVYLGADYHGAAPWPVKCYKIAQHEPGNNGTRVYQVWHDGDSNHHYGALYEVRLNSWGGADSNNYFSSATISCVHGMVDDMSLLCYKSTDGIWIRPSTIWGGLYIRRSGWDGSGRDRGSSYCSVKNGGALASADINGMGGTIPGSIDKRLYCYVDTYSPGQSYGGRDIEDGNDFCAG